MRCFNCHKDNPEGSTFCKYCGIKLMDNDKFFTKKPDKKYDGPLTGSKEVSRTRIIRENPSSDIKPSEVIGEREIVREKTEDLSKKKSHIKLYIFIAILIVVAIILTILLIKKRILK